jgi:hypothetical protein
MGINFPVGRIDVQMEGFAVKALKDKLVKRLQRDRYFS